MVSSDYRGVYVTPDELQQLLFKVKQRHFGADKAGAKFTIPAEVFQGFDAGNSLGIDALTVPVKAKLSVQDKTFANVLLWSLSHDTTSVHAIQEQFKMGWSKANKLVKRLEELGVVGEPFAKLPRCVVPTEIDDLPVEMVEFLQRNGVAAILSARHLLHGSKIKIGGNYDEWKCF